MNKFGLLVPLLLIGGMQRSKIDYGTCVAFYVQENFMAIAVDSQINHEKGIKSVAQKLHNYNNITWVSTGLYRFGDVFNIDTLIKFVLSKNQSIEQSQIDLVKLVTTGLKSAVQNIKELKLDNILKVDTPILTTLICTVVNGKIIFEHRNYYYVPDQNSFKIENKLIENQTNIGPDENIFNILGSDKTAKPILQRILSEGTDFITKSPGFKVDNMPNIKLSTISGILYYLVYVETINNPNDVGTPISVIYLDKDGLTPVINYPVK